VGDEPEKEAAEASPEESAAEPAVSAVDQTQEIPVVVASEPDAEPAGEQPGSEAAETEAQPEPEPEPEPAPAESETPAEAEDPEPEPAAAPAAVAVPEAEDGPAHARPRRSGWRTAGIAVGAVVALAAAAAAGVAVGRSTAPGPDIVVQPEPVVAESSGTEEMPAAEQPTPVAEALPTLTVSGSRPARATAILTAAPGLADTPGTAAGYRLVNAGISGGQVAAVLASTFGAVGTPVESDGVWTVGDGGAASLKVTADPLFTWTFEDPAGLASPALGQQLEPGEAIELASTILAGIGVDVSAVDWQVDLYADRTTAIAWQLVSGQRTQLSWQLSFDPDGAVVEASGFSAGLEQVPDYPVVGAATAVSRLGAAPWWTLAPTRVAGPAGTEDTAPPAEDSVPSASASVAPSTSPAPSPSASASTAADRPSLVVPVADVTVIDAELGLAQYWQPDGSVLMLPSYTVTGEDGSTWSVLAVDDAYVQFVDQPERPGETS